MSTTTPKCPNQEDPQILTNCESLGHSSAKSASTVKENISYIDSLPLMKLWCYSRAEAPSGNTCLKCPPSGNTNAGAYATPQMVPCIMFMYTRGQVRSSTRTVWVQQWCCVCLNPCTTKTIRFILITYFKCKVGKQAKSTRHKNDWHYKDG